MTLTDIEIHLCSSAGRLKAYCCLTLDHDFVIRDVKIIDGDHGLFLAMPSRKLTDHCPKCKEKNHLRAKFCNQCGTPLDELRHSGNGRVKLHADVAHPIAPKLRSDIEQRVLTAYKEELTRATEPGYRPAHRFGPIDHSQESDFSMRLIG